MQNKLRWSALAFLIGVSISTTARAQSRGSGRPAPASMPGAFTFIPKADLEAVMGPTRGDRPARGVNIASGANLGAFILHYEPTKNTTPPNSFYHSQVRQLYYVIPGEERKIVVWGQKEE